MIFECWEGQTHRVGGQRRVALYLQQLVLRAWRGLLHRWWGVESPLFCGSMKSKVINSYQALSSRILSVDDVYLNFYFLLLLDRLTSNFSWSDCILEIMRSRIQSIGPPSNSQTFCGCASFIVDWEVASTYFCILSLIIQLDAINFVLEFLLICRIGRFPVNHPITTQIWLCVKLMTIFLRHKFMKTSCTMYIDYPRKKNLQKI